MPTYILDTDTATHLRAHHIKVAARVSQVAAAVIAVSAITVEEQIKGWYDQLHQSNQPGDIEWTYGRLAETVQFYSTMQIVNYTAIAVLQYHALRKLKLNIDPPDFRISAIALAVNSIVVTCNVRDFSRVPGLVVEDWSV